MIPTSYISVRSFEGKGHAKKKARLFSRKNRTANKSNGSDRAVSLAFTAGMFH